MGGEGAAAAAERQRQAVVVAGVVEWRSTAETTVQRELRRQPVRRRARRTWSKKEITSESSIFTSAPITPNDVSLRYSNGRFLLTVLRKGYRNNGMCAAGAEYHEEMCA